MKEEDSTPKGIYCFQLDPQNHVLSVGQQHQDVQCRGSATPVDPSTVETLPLPDALDAVMVPAPASAPHLVDLCDDDTDVAPAPAQESQKPVAEGSYASQKADQYALEAR